MNDEETISNVLDEEKLESAKDKNGDVEILVETIWHRLGDVCQALEVLQRYIKFNDNGECIHKYIN